MKQKKSCSGDCSVAAFLFFEHATNTFLSRHKSIKKTPLFYRLRQSLSSKVLSCNHAVYAKNI